MDSENILLNKHLQAILSKANCWVAKEVPINLSFEEFGCLSSWSFFGSGNTMEDQAGVLHCADSPWKVGRPPLSELTDG